MGDNKIGGIIIGITFGVPILAMIMSCICSSDDSNKALLSFFKCLYSLWVLGSCIWMICYAAVPAHNAADCPYFV